MRPIQEKVDEIFGVNRPEAFGNHTCIAPPIGCGKPITGFKDTLSAKEYQLTGMCQNCQDAFEAMMDEMDDFRNSDMEG